MSLGKVYQFVDFSNGTGGDTGEPLSSLAPLPLLDGQDLDAANIGRAPENLRQRTEALRSVMFDVLYMLDADRNGMCLSGPGLVSWGGSTTAGGTGIFTLTDNLYLMPFLTPGQNQTPPVPPVTSKFGTLTLKRADAAAGIVVTSTLRSYKYGNFTSVTVVAGSTYGIQVLDSFRTIVITATATTTLSQVISDLNALTVDSPAVSIVSATLAGGALGTDTLLRPQAKQFMSGNADAEAHTITPAALTSFFATAANKLAEGDTLAIAYAANTYGPSDPAPLGGRRQSIPENSNTSVPAGSLFNSRVSPGSLVNALPICKVVNGKLVFVQGTQIPANATGIELGGVTGATMVYQGGGNWADGTTNPLTTIEGQLDKIIADLSSDGARKLGFSTTAYSWGTRPNESIYDRVQAIEQAKANIAVSNTFSAPNTFRQVVLAPLDETEANAPLQTLVAPVTLYKPLTTSQGASIKTRTYIKGVSGGSTGGLVITNNAKWDPNTTQWQKDDTGQISTYMEISMYGIYMKQIGVGGSPWPDGVWVDVGTNSFTSGLQNELFGLLTLGYSKTGSTSDALLPRLSLRARNNADLTLLFESVPLGQAGYRVYISGNGAQVFFMMNMKYLGGGVYQKDIAGDAVMFNLYGGANPSQTLSYCKKTGVGDPPGTFTTFTSNPLNFYHDGPDSTAGGPFQSLLNGIIDLTPPVEGAHGSPDASVNIANKLTSKNLVKSWFYGSSNGSGGWTLSKGFNCTTSFGTYFGTPYVNFHFPSGFNYDYSIFTQRTNGLGYTSTILGQGIFDCKVVFYNTSSTPIDLSTTGGWVIAMMVLGTQI